MVRQARLGRPIRVIKPKARKLGVSTLIQAMFVFLCKHLNGRRALTYAHTDDASREIFRIARRVHTGGQDVDESPETSIEFESGSLYTCGTLGSKGAARGGTPHLMHISELAALQSKTGIDAKAIGAMLNAVPDEPHTIIVIESTGDGPRGEFHAMCVKARNGENEYELDFSPWFQDPGYSREPEPGFELTPAEATMKARFDLTDAQVFWFRRKRANQPNDQIFKREYPTTFDDCFAAASGRVYPEFSSGSVKEGGHVGTTKVRPSWERYRSIDWGSGGNHPFVCLWIAHDPDRDPGIMVDPSCKETINEFLTYAYDARSQSDRPIKDFDHAMDALRYAVCTFRLSGFVYVYRELYMTDPPSPELMAAEIHERSGWALPEGASPKEVWLYEQGTDGEKFEESCADRSQQKMIELFRGWGIEPLNGDRDPSGSKSSRGRVKDGIAMVRTLISGHSRLEPRGTDEVRAVHAVMAQVPNRRRPVLLSRAQRKLIRNEDTELREEVAGLKIDDDEPMGYV